MAQYKVPQDVEADDKLLGPFSPRQVLYLFVAAILIFLIVSSFSLSELIGFILILLLGPVAIFMLIIALPLRKDQPTEVYIIALIDFYFKKPHNRFWIPGQRETTVKITAPHIIDAKSRIRDITTDEANRRLSFLSDVIDSEGESIRGNWSPVKEEYLAEAATAPDMFESYSSELIDRQISAESALSRDELIARMRSTLDAQASLTNEDDAILNQPPLNTPNSQTPIYQSTPNYNTPEPNYNTPYPPVPSDPFANTPVPNDPFANAPEPENPAKKAALEALSKNTEYSVATIAKEADRIEKKKDGEIYISLH